MIPEIILGLSIIGYLAYMGWILFRYLKSKGKHEDG